MGLDSYAVKVVSADADKFSHITHLCGGLFSGNGSDASFRGKVYAEAISDITDVSLYNVLISPETVETMYDYLKDASYDLVEEWGLEPEEADDLIAFFKVCADEHYGLSGWW
jgi:hypothetical protein